MLFCDFLKQKSEACLKCLNQTDLNIEGWICKINTIFINWQLLMIFEFYLLIFNRCSWYNIQNKCKYSQDANIISQVQYMGIYNAMWRPQCLLLDTNGLCDFATWYLTGRDRNNGHLLGAGAIPVYPSLCGMPSLPALLSVCAAALSVLGDYLSIYM